MTKRPLGGEAKECAECAAKELKIQALQESIYGCARRVSELSARVRGLPVEPTPQEWQPIETIQAAAKEKLFLVYWPNGDTDVLGWKEYNEIISYGEPPATHWMPLPPAPVPVSSQEETAQRKT